MEDNCCLEELEAVFKNLVRLIHLFERDQIAVYNLSSAQYYTLLELSKAAPLSMNELSSKLNVAISTCSRVVDKLVRQGHIERSRDPIDRRIVLLQLTSSGNQQVEAVKAHVSKYYRNIISHIPTGELDETLASTQRLMRAFELANPHCC